MKELKYFKRILEAEKEDDTFASDSPTEETGATADDKPTTPEDDETNNEEQFTKMLDDVDFVTSYKTTLKQYVSENLLYDEYNSFTVLPFFEVEYKDESYGFSVEFETAVTINVDENDKIIEKNLTDVDTFKYKTPTMDNLVLLEDKSATEMVSLFTMEALNEIKK